MNIVFWILPLVVFIQKNFRFMCDYGVKTFRRQQGRVSIHKIYVDELLGKGEIFPAICTIKFDLPSEKLWNRYLELKTVWNDQNLIDDIQYIEDSLKPDVRTILKDEYLQLRNEKLKMDLRFKENKISNINHVKDVWER